MALPKESTVERDLVEYIAKSLVDDPAAVNVNVIEEDKATILELRVAADDIGKVIGKQGRIAKAIRTILSASAAGADKRITFVSRAIPGNSATSSPSRPRSSAAKAASSASGWPEPPSFPTAVPLPSMVIRRLKPHGPSPAWRSGLPARNLPPWARTSGMSPISRAWLS